MLNVSTPGRVFAYCRPVSNDPDGAQQVAQIKAAGFRVFADRVVTETDPATKPALNRAGFVHLTTLLTTGDAVVVTRLDGLGRNAVDVRATVDALADLGVAAHCLALGAVNLSSPEGRMTMDVLSAVAEFERDLVRERTQVGLNQAKAEGKALGRPSVLSAQQQLAIRQSRAAGVSLGVLAKQYGVSRAAIQRVQKRAL